MRYYIFIIACLLYSCSKDEVMEGNPVEEDCAYLQPVGLSLEAKEKSVLVNYGYANVIIEVPGKICLPQMYELYVSDDRVDFEKVGTFDEKGSYLHEGLEDGQIISFKVIGLHDELESVVSQIRTVMVGDISEPQFIDNPMGSPNNQFEDFRLAPDGDRFIYRTNSDNWYQSSFSNPVKGEKILFDAFYAQWSPFKENQIVGIEQTYVQILPNLQGKTSKEIVAYDFEVQAREAIYEIEDHWDFNNDEFNPDIYWIHEFHFSLDGESLYCVSNKDNGSTNRKDQSIYDNIWKLDLESRDFEQITDFLPSSFDLEDFVEDPNQHGNFYIAGGTYDEMVVNEGSIFPLDKIDVYYYNAADQSLSLLFSMNDEINHLSINPTGDQLVFASSVTGNSELWSYHISDQSVRQITSSQTYRPSHRWHFLNWISDIEFMTYVRHEEVWKFAVIQVN